MSNLLEVKKLTKVYGKNKILDEFSMTLGKGDILGILGPNGSGKTSLIKCIVGLIRNYKGNIYLNGEEIEAYTRNDIAYLPDEDFFDRNMTIDFASEHYSRLFNNFNQEKYEQLLNFMDLNRKYKIETMSKGMREKFYLSLVLSREAKLYILDEPISGVDPLARDKIIESILLNYNPDSSMIITTHQVKDLEKLFNKVLFIKDGKNHLQGDTENLREDYRNDIESIYKIFYKKEV